LRNKLKLSVVVLATLHLLLCLELAYSTDWNATYELKLSVSGKPPYNVAIYSKNGTPIFEARLNNNTPIRIALSQGTYYLAVIGNEDGSLAAYFKRIELISNIAIVAKLTPISHYQIKEVRIQVLYPNGSPAANIDVMAYPIGLPRMLYMAKTDKDGFAKLQVLNVPIIVEAQGPLRPLKTREMSISNFIQQMIASKELSIKNGNLRGDIIIVEKAVAYRAKDIVEGHYKTITLHQEVITSSFESYLKEVLSSVSQAKEQVLGSSEKAFATSSLLTIFGILGASALIALAAFIVIRHRV